MQRAARARIQDGQARQRFKNAVSRVFSAAAEYAGGQEMLDLKEEENPYIMADVNYSVVHASETYEPVSGKTQANFYVEFKANSDPEWNIKFMQMADKYYQWSVNCITMYIQNNSKMIAANVTAQQSGAQA